MHRRSFLVQATTGASALALAPLAASATPAAPPPPPTERAYWLATLLRVADPILSAAAAGRLKATLPVETAAGQQAGRRNVTHLEALGRT